MRPEEKQKHETMEGTDSFADVLFLVSIVVRGSCLQCTSSQCWWPGPRVAERERDRVRTETEEGTIQRGFYPNTLDHSLVHTQKILGCLMCLSDFC